MAINLVKNVVIGRERLLGYLFISRVFYLYEMVNPWKVLNGKAMTIHNLLLGPPHVRPGRRTVNRWPRKIWIIKIWIAVPAEKHDKDGDEERGKRDPVANLIHQPDLGHVCLKPEGIRRLRKIATVMRIYWLRIREFVHTDAFVVQRVTRWMF